MEDKNKEALARQYILGKLSEEEATRLEEDYFASDDTFEEMEVAEDEIIDAYVRDELSSEDSKLVKENLLTSSRISRRVGFAKILAAKASRKPVSQAEESSPAASHEQQKPVPNVWSWKDVFWPASVWQRAAFSALAIVIAVGTVSLIIDWLRVRKESNRLSASTAALESKNRDLIAENNQRALETQRLAEELKTQKAENAILNEQIERTLNKPSSAVPVISILLSISGSRTLDNEKVVKLPAEPTILQLRIPLEEVKYDRYLVTITSDERPVSAPRELKASGKMLTLRLSSTRFVRGDYIVTVSGVTPSGQAIEIEDYTLRII